MRADVLQFWTTANGVIMCSDNRALDALGIQAGTEVVGRPFSNLCTDVEGVNKWVLQSVYWPEHMKFLSALSSWLTGRNLHIHAAR